MGAHLRLVVDHVPRGSGSRRNGNCLRHLAQRLIESVRSGHVGFAPALAECEVLTPIEMGIVSTWMFQAGIAENVILSVLVGQHESADGPPMKAA